MSSIKNQNGNLYTNGNVTGKNINTNSVNGESTKLPWEFFSKIGGLVTDILNHQINIPSTAFTPGFSLPTKAILVNIIRAKDTMLAINNKIKAISNCFDKEHSLESSHKDLVNISIVKSIKNYYKEK